MSILKIKSIGLLAASVLFSSQEAIAEDHWGAGIKASGSISFMKESAKMTKEIEDVKKSGIDVSTNYFNPWFGAGIYAEYAFFNDHIGVGTEILYNRFIGSFSRSSKPNSAVAPNISDTDTGTDTIRTDTIAFPLTFGVYWTSFIRPDFKDDYFLARLFFGICPVVCFGDKATSADPGKIPKINNDIRRRFGFIGGHSFEFPNGLLLELKGLLPYNLYDSDEEDNRPFVTSCHLSLGYNFAKLLEN